MQVSRLDAELLERFYARLHRCREMCTGRPAKSHVCRPLSTSTTRKIHYIIRGTLKRAVRWGYVGVNAAAMAYAPTPARTRPDPPSADEAAALLNDAWRDPEWGLLLWLTMVTGCRRGELCSIRWRNVDLSRGDPWLERSTAETRSGVFEKTPKSGEGRRVSLDPNTVELLRKHKVDVTKQLLELGVVGLTGDAFVFSTTPDYSQPCKPRSVTQKYRKMAVRLGARIRPASSRHQGAVQRAARGGHDAIPGPTTRPVSGSSHESSLSAGWSAAEGAVRRFGPADVEIQDPRARSGPAASFGLGRWATRR